MKKYIYGWPEEGGVWVLHLPPLLDKHINSDPSLDEELDQMEHWDSIEHTVFRDLYGSVHYGDLVDAVTMKGFCGRLEDGGARFYEKAEDSPEVIEEGLLNLGAALQKDAVQE
jgi:hypothetical protein